jgi:ATP-dependent Clp protease adaptor protein ClpS
LLFTPVVQASQVLLHKFNWPLEIFATRGTMKVTSKTTGQRNGMATKREEGTVLEARRSKLKPPPLFKVLLLNDDYTPMDFVIIVLQQFFLKSREQATQIMLKVHREGLGVCGVYPKDVAATKVDQVMAFARQHQHPLQCVMEET